MKSFKTLDALDATGKTVLLRADLNVPMKNGNITDTTRIDRVVPTLRALMDKGAKIVVLSHFGRPDGKPNPDMSLKPVAAALEQALGAPVAFAADCIGDAAQSCVAALGAGQVAMLENVRFHAGEEENDPAFTRSIAALGDVFVHDAFSAAHRAHATTCGLAEVMPAYAGRLMQAELDALNKALEAPERPVTAIVGGAKISTKLDLLNNLVRKIDTLVLGGGMANTFLYAKGVQVGKSLCEKDMADTARTIIATAAEYNCKILLPVDGVTAKEFKPNPETQVLAIDAVGADDMILDIGQGTVAAVSDVLRRSRTVLWNGPVGAFETPPFENGTVSIAKVVADLTRSQGLVSVAGGGDTVAALVLADVEHSLTYLSSAGGAFLEWLEGKELPGVAALCANSARAA